MAGDIAERERRIRQFEHYLNLMEHRTLRLAKERCFVIFTARADSRVRRRLVARSRFVQFAFSETGFYLEMPDTTLTPEEARRAVAERPGFTFALDGPEKAPGDLIFDPVQRDFSYGEQRAAAEDAAYVFFDLWETALDAWVKVEASSFESDRTWERGFSMG